MKYIGTTIEGLEKAAIKEAKGKLISPGRILFTKYSENYLTLNSIYQLIEEYNFKTLKDLTKKIEKTNIENKETFKCRCSRTGKHDFNSVIAEQEIGKILIKKGLKYSREKPKNTIFIDIIQNKCFLGILKKENLSKRKYRLRLHNQTTHPLLASCLIKYLNIKENNSLLVLESKDGIISIEAALQKIKNITAQDSEKNNTRNAQINAKLAKAKINFITKNLQEFKPDKQDYIITQLIFSKKRKQSVNKIQKIFSIAKSSKSKLAIITNHPEDLENYKEKIEIKIGKSTLYILIYKK